MLRRAGCLTLATALLPLATAGAAYAQPPPCEVVVSSGRCLVEAIDPGRPGGPAEADDTGPDQDENGGDGPSRGNPPSGRPTQQDVPEEPAPRRPSLQPLIGENGGPTGFVAGPDRSDELLALLAEGADPNAPAPLAVDPAIPAQLAINELELSGPVIRLSTGDNGFVGVPVWLWIERDQDLTGPRSATAAVGNAEVTATGRLAAVEWELGPSGERVVCEGPGTPWTGQAGPSPDCGYVYELRSLPERTGGSGRWPIVATIVWQVGWVGISGGAPVSGQQTVRVSADTSVSVGEIQVLVSGGGS
ncbi:ATP/GTP-binding protein [Pseudonocardia petroleophila]